VNARFGKNSRANRNSIREIEQHFQVVKRASKLIVLTGVSRGLGRAMTEQFAALGHTVVGCARSRPQIDFLRKNLSDRHDFSVLDVTDDTDVQKWAARVLKEKGVPDFLINNAALINRSAPLWQVSAQDFSAVMDTNVKGAANTIRHFVPSMVEQGRGVIVNFSSGWGRSTDAEVAPYCASKWAIEGLTQALAQELPKAMAAIPLNPGIIDTEMLRSCFGDSASSYPDATTWAERAVPFILKLGPSDNGQPLSIP
jgi:NAD(P)-dependent dehydrogenase (short-subunit alcohol dehydrogenase family)